MRKLDVTYPELRQVSPPGNITLSVEVDRHLRVASWGADISRFTGRNPADAIGRDYFEVLPRIIKDDRDAVRMVAEDGRDLEIPGYVSACFNSFVRTGVSLKALRDGDGQICGVNVAFSPQARCPVERQLCSSQWLIDIGKMTTTLAHGVRSPLNAIKGAINFLSERDAGDEVFKEFTTIIEEEIARLDQFISVFLSTSLSDIEKTDTDVNAVLRKIEEYTALQSNASPVEYAFEYGDLPLARTSGFHLEQAVLNVVNNALEAMPAGGRLDVRTGVSARADGDYIHISISDNGPGMSGVDGKTPRDDKGKGYGLFITREILSSLGGSLEIDSRKGEGTVVSLYLAADGV